MAYNHLGDVIAGSTSVSLDIVLRKKADNTELTGIAYNTSGNIASYRRQGAARTAISLVTQTVTGAYSSGGFVEIDSTNQPGLYRLDVPDAAWATGVDYVDISFVTTSGYVYHERIALSQVTFTVAGQVDANTKSLAGTASAGVAGKVGIDLSAVTLYGVGNFPATGIVDSGTAQSVTATTIVIRAAASFPDHTLEGATVVIRSATTGAAQARKITGWVSSTNTATVDTWTTTPTGTIVYDIFGVAPGSTTSPSPADIRQVLGNAVTAATSGILDVNAKNIANIAAVMDANGFLKVDVEDWKAATAAAMTGDAYARLGPPAGASVSADIANVPTNTLGFTFGAAYGSKSLQQILQIIIAMVAGVTSGAGTATETFKTPDGSATVLTIANSSGNRVTVTLS